ncbi:MAG: histidine phosphatase family protein [Candidatus Promineifilaceae bacterium]|nr:histidine phosphatase family protein [Candidatus Promineifilaceae bacterium]
MKTLLIMRHANAGWGNAKMSDHERPLNEQGLREAAEMGRILIGADLTPQRLICSSAERALVTAERVALASGYAAEIEVTDRLYLAPPGAYIAYLNRLPQDVERVLIVGHNPGIGELAALLTGEGPAFPTATLAQVALPLHTWSKLSQLTRGRLVNLWRPAHPSGE